MTLGEVELPPSAKLVQSKIVGTTYAPDNFITLASADKSVDGMLLSTFIDATSADPNYLCVLSLSRARRPAPPHPRPANSRRPQPTATARAPGQRGLLSHSQRRRQHPVPLLRHGGLLSERLLL